MHTDPYLNRNIRSSSIDDASSSIGSDRSSSSWASFAAGVCAGAAVGAAIGLVAAPMRGSELRGKLQRYASQGGDQLSSLIASGRSLAEDALHQATSLIEQGRRALRTSVPSGVSPARATSEPLTASVAEISGNRRFDEPLGG